MHYVVCSKVNYKTLYKDRLSLRHIIRQHIMNLVHETNMPYTTGYIIKWSEYYLNLFVSCHNSWIYVNNI